VHFVLIIHGSDPYRITGCPDTVLLKELLNAIDTHTTTQHAVFLLVSNLTLTDSYTFH
jgi:hypothetical protein